MHPQLLFIQICQLFKNQHLIPIIMNSIKNINNYNFNIYIKIIHAIIQTKQQKNISNINRKFKFLSNIIIIEKPNVYSYFKL